MVLNAPFIKTLYIDFPPSCFGAVSQSYLRPKPPTSLNEMSIECACFHTNLSLVECYLKPCFLHYLHSVNFCTSYTFHQDY